MKQKKYKVQEPVLAIIEKCSHDGRGIARINGKTTFIEGALPQETVKFVYTRKKNDFDEGRVESVIEPSVFRVEPKCPNYTVCGGCSLQHLDAGQQIQEKQTQLLDLLVRVGHCQPEKVLPPLTANAWNYRNKARLSVRYVDKKQSTLVGFREKQNPRYIADIAQCPILNSKLSDKIQLLRILIDHLDDPKSIAQIEVAIGNEVALLFRNLTELSAKDKACLQEFAIEHQFRIFLQPGGPSTVTLFYPDDGNDFLHYQLEQENITFRFHPTDFTQVNEALNQKMVALAVELLALESDDVVLDLFCGLGNFSLPIAKYAAQVIGVEGSSAMVERAGDNAALNNIKNVQFLASNLEETAIVDQIKPYSFNKVLLDPPRTGALAMVKLMGILKPKRIVYVSCNPATLARDAGVLVNELGYSFAAAGVMDMFPHTAHVESIAVFEMR